MFEPFGRGFDGGVVCDVEVNEGYGSLNGLGLDVFEDGLAFAEVACADYDVVFWGGEGEVDYGVKTDAVCSAWRGTSVLRFCISREDRWIIPVTRMISFSVWADISNWFGTHG